MNDIKFGPHGTHRVCPNELLLTVYLFCNGFSCSRPFVMLPYLSFPCQSKRSCPGGYLAQHLGRHPLTAPGGMRDDDRVWRDKRDDDDDDDATPTVTSQLLIAKDISQT